MLETSAAMSQKGVFMAEQNHTSDQDTIQIPLTKGYIAIVDKIDEDLASLKWQSLKSKYAYRKIGPLGKAKCQYMHRVILARMLGRDLYENEVVDHIDKNGLNNRRSNLRLATPKENSRYRNTPMTNTSGYMGVLLDKRNGRWFSKIVENGTNHFLGSFVDKVDAARAYNAAAKKYFGDFAPQNILPTISEKGE